MKNSILIFIIILNSLLFANDPESLDLKVEGTNSTVTDKNVYANCCSVFMMTYKTDENTFTVIETDTSTQKCKCMCHFDLEFHFNFLSSGSYRVEVFRQELSKFGYSQDTLIFIGYKEFVIINPLEPPTNVFFKQSDCLTQDNHETNNNNITVIYPNPATDYLSFSLSDYTGLIRIYNPLGIKILETEYSNQINIKVLSPGIYFIQLNSGLYKFIKI
jgi:hypothetical protein